MVLRPSERRLYEHLCQLSRRNDYAPTISEIQDALELSSRSFVQDLLRRLTEKGYIQKQPRRARTISVQCSELPLRGMVQAGYLTEHPECCDRIRLEGQRYPDGAYALRVTGDSMAGARIFDGDVVVVRPERDLWAIRPGQIAVVWIAGEGATLKRVTYQEGDRTLALAPANDSHPHRTLARDQVELQGVMVGLHRCDAGLWVVAEEGEPQGGGPM